MSETGRARPAYQRSVSGLVGAIIAVLLLIVAVWALTFAQRRDAPDPVPTVDYRQTLAQARSEATFAVLAPRPEPAGWRATSVTWTGGRVATWHVGFLTSDGDYVGLDQSADGTDDVLAAVTNADTPAGTVSVGGVDWDVLTGPTDTALVHETDDVVVVVSGTAPRDQLVGFAESLTAD